MTGSLDNQRSVRTTCPYCGVGCGVIATPDGQGGAQIKGDPEHPANYGRLCSKGSALGDTLDLEERLLSPVVNGEDVSWDIALDKVASTFKSTIEQYGPNSVAFYVSGQLLTEDYYVANKLMKGYFGSANIDTNSRLCMASSVAGHKRAFGSDTVPGRYEDIEQADLVVLVGSNFAWCHPVLHQRLLAAKSERGLRLVVIDPRETATTEAADLHLAIKPGADVALFNGLLAHLVESPAFDSDYVSHYTSGLSDALNAIGPINHSALTNETGLPQSKIQRFFSWVSATKKTVTIYSQGVNQSSAGTDKVNAIINTHLATGRIGRSGMGPFSITGQPNAMGGREVGGLANQLAAHMDFAAEDVDRVQRFWNSPVIADTPGLKAVDMFDAVANGTIKALWIMATNPVVSLPQADKVKAAIQSCPFVVVSDVVATSDTVKLAHIQLPATAWGEKTGTVTNSERCISRQRSFLPSPGKARHDWDIISDVARRMGYDGFEYVHESEIFREYAQMTGYENAGARDLDISKHAEIDGETYNKLEPFYWPAPASGQAEGRFFSEGAFFTSDKRARFVPTPFRTPASKTNDQYGFVMNTGRVRDHWHTMTRTGKAARLSSHIGEPYLEIHPKDASNLGVSDAELVVVKSELGRVVLRALITDRVQPGHCFAPFHWTDRFASCGRVDVLLPPYVDPVSGQPEAKHTPIAIEALKADWHGFAVCNKEPNDTILSQIAYWSKARIANGWALEIAAFSEMADLDEFLTTIVGIQEEIMTVCDATFGQQSRARFNENNELSAFIIASTRGPVSADRGWLSKQIGTKLDIKQRLSLLAGRPPAGQGDGRIVCSCLGVGRNTIMNATLEGARTVAEIGAATCAGTNCGSCKPEIAQIINSLVENADSDNQVAAE